MAIANSLQRYLQQHHTQYYVLYHEHSNCSMDTAHKANIPADSLAKSVVLRDGTDYLMAVLPANRQVDLHLVDQATGGRYCIAHEYEFSPRMGDCELGAIPPVGGAYNMKVLVDDALTWSQDIYFEAGDHEELVHMKTSEFMDLMIDASTASFSRRTM